VLKVPLNPMQTNKQTNMRVSAVHEYGFTDATATAYYCHHYCCFLFDHPVFLEILKIWLVSPESFM